MYIYTFYRMSQWSTEIKQIASDLPVPSEAWAPSSNGVHLQIGQQLLDGASTLG